MTVDKDRKFLTLKEKSRLYYLKNRERIIAKVRAWQIANPEQNASNKARWAADNKDRLKVHAKAYQERKRVGLAGRS